MSNTSWSLSDFDRIPAQFSLSFNSVKRYQSKAGGCFSLTYIAIIATLLSLKLIDLLSRNHIYLTPRVEKGNDRSPLQLELDRFSIALREVSDGKYKDITYSQLHSYGIQITVQHLQITVTQKQQIMNQQTLQTFGCQNNQICIDCKNNCKRNISGRSDYLNKIKDQKGQISYADIKIIIKSCDKTKYIDCADLTQTIRPYIIFTTNKIQAQNIHHNLAIAVDEGGRAFSTFSLIKSGHCLFFQIQFVKAIVQTYYSVLPQVFHSFENQKFQKSQTWLYDQEIKSQLLPARGDTYAAIYLRRSTQTFIYTRQYQKLDQMLGSFVGFISLIGMIIFGLYRGYNQWSFEQYMRKTLKFSYVQPTLWKFYQIMFRKLYPKLFCCCSKVQQNQEQIKEEIEFKKQIDYFLSKNISEFLIINQTFKEDEYVLLSQNTKTKYRSNKNLQNQDNRKPFIIKQSEQI